MFVKISYNLLFTYGLCKTLTLFYYMFEWMWVKIDMNVRSHGYIISLLIYYMLYIYIVGEDGPYKI